MTLIIVIAVLAVIVLWFISCQNRLVKDDEFCNNSLKQINVQQVSRYDALKALVKITKDYASYEGETLEKVIAERKIVSAANPTVSDINANEAALGGVLARLVAVAERYPDLKANAQYTKTMDSVNKYEDNVRLARMTYNDTVTKYNNSVRMFPGSIVAGILGFPRRDYLAEDTSKAEYPEI